MTRRLLFLIALASAFVASAGCTTMSKLGQVIMDPSVPVGQPEDQPTEVAFSINVSPTINRNPNSLAAILKEKTEVEPGTYAASLNTEQSPATAPQEMEHDTEVEPAQSPVVEDTPGSYDDPAFLLDSPNETAEASEQIATPIAIKILQLRDDSLLRNSLYQTLDSDLAKTLRSTYIHDDDYLLFPGQFKFVPFTKVHAETRYIAVIADYGSEQDTTWKQVLRIEPQGRHIVLSLQVQDSQLILKEEGR